jgi:hypothetical protein
LSFYIVSNPEHGSLANVDWDTNKVTGASVLYTPTEGYTGTDSFKFKVGDGTAFSGDFTVNISVKHVNHKPTVTGTSVTIDEDTEVTITVTGTDPDGDKLEFFVGNLPALGSVENFSISSHTGNTTTATIRYTPTENANGDDSFTFYANDGALNSEEATVSIHINPINDPPEFLKPDLFIVTQEDTPATINVDVEDPEGDDIELSVVSSAWPGVGDG